MRALLIISLLISGALSGSERDKTSSVKHLQKAPNGPAKSNNLEKLSEIAFGPGPDFPWSVCPICYGSACGVCLCMLTSSASVPVSHQLMAMILGGMECMMIGKVVTDCGAVVEQFGSEAEPAAAVSVAAHYDNQRKRCGAIHDYHCDRCIGSTCRAYAGCLETARALTPCLGPLRECKYTPDMPRTIIREGRRCIGATGSACADCLKRLRAHPCLIPVRNRASGIAHKMVQTGTNALAKVLDTFDPNHEHKQ